MTDVRATERLLEVIEERCTSIRRWISDGHPGTEDADNAIRDADALFDAAAELRRRGDTLVRRVDLRLVATAANHGRQFGLGGDTDYTGFNDAIARIENALGGPV